MKYYKDTTCVYFPGVQSTTALMAKEIHHHDDKHYEECTFGCNVKRQRSSCHTASRVNKEARVWADENVCIQLGRISIRLCLPFSFPFSLSIHSRTCVYTLHHVRNYVYALRCMPVDCLPSADSQMIASDCTLLGASNRSQSQQAVGGWQQRGDSHPVILIRKLRPDSAEICSRIWSDYPTERGIICHFEIVTDVEQRGSSVHPRNWFEETIYLCNTLLLRFIDILLLFGYWRYVVNFSKQCWMYLWMNHMFHWEINPSV